MDHDLNLAPPLVSRGDRTQGALLPQVDDCSLDELLVMCVNQWRHAMHANDTGGNSARLPKSRRSPVDDRGWPKAIAVSGLLVYLLVACGGSASPGASYRIATHPTTEFTRTARAGGTLNGTLNGDGTACLWLGDGSDRIALVWPDGYVARSDPLAVIDEHGKQVALVGRKVTLKGGLGPTGKVTGCEGIEQTWAVGQVIESV